MFYYQHHIGDFDLATRHLSRIERSIYRDLIEVYYDTEEQLTHDQQALCRRIIARSTDEVTAVEQVLNEFFVKTPDGWYHVRCEEELDKYRTTTSQKSIAGKASAAARKKKLEDAINGKSTAVEQSMNKSLTNHKPITNNHKPVTKEKTAPDGDLLLGIDPQIVSDFKALRAKHRAPITKTAMDGIKREAQIAGISFEDALKLCCERNWRGFKADWIKKDMLQGTSKQSRHNGFENIDYSEGVTKDGRIA